MELRAFGVQQELDKTLQCYHFYSHFWVHLNPAHILFSRSALDTQKTEQP